MVRWAVLLIALNLLSLPAEARTPWTLVLEVVDHLGTAVGNLADGIGRAVDEGLEIHDELTLRSLREDVIALNDQIARLTAEQSTLTAQMAEHAETRRPAENWEDLQFQLGEIAPAIQGLIVSIDDLGPRLVEVAGPQVVHELRVALRSRASLVRRLRGLGPPTTEEERAALAELLDRYRDLIVNLQKLNQALFEFTQAAGGNG